jgi:hypothetical protein
MSTGGPLVVYWQPFLLSGVECLRRSDLLVRTHRGIIIIICR